MDAGDLEVSEFLSDFSATRLYAGAPMCRTRCFAYQASASWARFGVRGNMIRAAYRDDIDDCHTLSMSGFGQARSLRPSELAHASVMGALCAAIAIIAVVLPHAGWARVCLAACRWGCWPIAIGSAL